MIWLLLLLCLPVQAKYEMVWDQDSAEYVQMDVRRTEDRVRMTDAETGEVSYSRVNGSGRSYFTDSSGVTYETQIKNGRTSIRKI